MGAQRFRGFLCRIVSGSRSALISRWRRRLLVGDARSVRAFGARRQRQAKGAAPSGLRLQGQRAAQQLRESTGDWQTESSAFSELGLAELHEFLEDALLILGSDAFTLVDHID